MIGAVTISLTRTNDNMSDYARYDETIPEKAYHIARLGATDVELAKCLGMSKSGLNKWKTEHPEFYEALQRGKQEFDGANVVGALKKRACGFTATERIYENDKEVRRVEKEVPPDTAACIFWLCNRNNEEWRQRQEVTGADGEPLNFTIISYKDIAKDGESKKAKDGDTSTG